MTDEDKFGEWCNLNHDKIQDLERVMSGISHQMAIANWREFSLASGIWKVVIRIKKRKT